MSARLLFFGGVAARQCSRMAAARQFSLSRPFCAAYHSYSLPTRSTDDSRNEDMTEASISFPETLPKVHETRPPPSTPSAPTTPAPPVATQSGDAATPSQPQRQPAPGEAADAAVTAPVTAKQLDKAAKPARPRSKLRPRKAAMKLTAAAVEQLRNLLNQPEPKLIKVGVRNRGCSGLAYHLEYVDKPGVFDETVEQDGVRVLIDSKALFSIIGSEMDWAEDKLSQRFIFRNPNIKEECGCGESFMV